MYLSRRAVLTSGLAGTAGLAADRAPAADKSPAAAGPSFAIQGIDVSHWQREVDFGQVADAGVTFCFCKATEGLTFIDPRFAVNWPAMKAAGLLRGAYHFGRPAADPRAQADFVHDTVRPTTGDLPLVLDLEQDDGVEPAAVRAWTEAFVARLRELLGVPPIIYTGLYFWRDKADDGDALDCPLWLPAYVEDPAKYVPQAWSHWTFWQYTSKGSVAGVRGNVDRDAWHGDRTALDALRLT